MDTLKKSPYFLAIQERIEAKQLYLTESQLLKAVQFAEILYRENAIQNLTRITGVSEFIDGHLIDVLSLFEFNKLQNKVLDLGSGCGVPGLLAAAIDLDSSRNWYLCDSELQKCSFLSLASKELGLKNAKVFHGRVEDVINEIRPDTVISRAVGTVEKIAGWISKCSTWNNLILFKSRGWDEEWSSSKKSKYGKKLTVTQKHEYAAAEKYRVLINLEKIKND